MQKALDHPIDADDYLLFGAVKASVELSSLHPDPAQIFKLWQIYLDNVNPLLKVTHTPSLQGQIVEAASNVMAIRPALEALMFGIYCMSILSLTTEDCQTMFDVSSKDLLQRYHFGCQQALLRCGFLRSGDRDCLTALYLYLVSQTRVHVTFAMLMMLDVCQTQYGATVVILNPRCRHPHRTTYGHSQRVGFSQMQSIRS